VERFDEQRAASYIGSLSSGLIFSVRDSYMHNIFVYLISKYIYICMFTALQF